MLGHERNTPQLKSKDPLTKKSAPPQSRGLKDIFFDKATQLAQTLNFGSRLWCPDQFSEIFDAADWRTKKELRKKVMLFTNDALSDGKYYAFNPRDVRVEVDIKQPLSLSREETDRNRLYIETEFIQLNQFPKYEKSSIRIVQMDSIDAGFDLIQNGKNPVVLNLANQNHPGGGYKNGAGAQEESLFRRSNYCEFLCLENSLYPIPEFGGIYSRNVLVFRERETKGYAFSMTPFFLSFVAQAAYNNPPLTQDGRLMDKFEEGTELKIRSILKIGLNHGHDSIVLGAFGCGAFSNPPIHIAEIFRKVIKEFDGYYSDIVFAIIEDTNSSKMSSIGNFAVFRDIVLS